MLQKHRIPWYGTFDPSADLSSSTSCHSSRSQIALRKILRCFASQPMSGLKKRFSMKTNCLWWPTWVVHKLVLSMPIHVVDISPSGIKKPHCSRSAIISLPYRASSEITTLWHEYIVSAERNMRLWPFQTSRKHQIQKKEGLSDIFLRFWYQYWKTVTLSKRLRFTAFMTLHPFLLAAPFLESVTYICSNIQKISSRRRVIKILTSCRRSPYFRSDPVWTISLSVSLKQSKEIKWLVASELHCLIVKEWPLTLKGETGASASETFITLLNVTILVGPRDWIQCQILRSLMNPG